MSLKSGLKVALLAGVVIGLSMAPGFAAKRMAMPAGSCMFQKKPIATGTACSFACDPNNWCSVQTCMNGQLTTMPIGCWGSFCAAKC